MTEQGSGAGGQQRSRRGQPPARRSTRYLDTALDSLPGSQTAGPGSSRRIKLLSVAFAAVIGIVILAATNIINLPFTQVQAEAQHDAEDKIDKKNPALEWHIDNSFSEGDAGHEWELDRRLTAQEEAKLAATNGDRQKVWDFFKERGGRRVGDFSTYLKIQFLSKRSDPVTITKLAARTVRCWVSDAKTVAYTGEGGVEAWEKIRFDFTNKADGNGNFPAIDAEAMSKNPLGEIKLWDKPIAVGGGETPGYVELAVETNKSCEWTLKATYNVGADESQTATIRDGDKNFVARAGTGEAESAWLVGSSTVKT